MNSRKCPMMEIYGHKWPWVRARLSETDKWMPMWRNGMVFETPSGELFLERIPYDCQVKYRINRNWSMVAIPKLWITAARHE